MSKIWHVKTLSFRGTVPGASHTYGAIVGPTGKFAVARELTETTARELNESNKRFGRDYSLDWESGDDCTIFNSDEQLHDAARVAFGHLLEVGLANDGDILVDGDWLGPARPIAGDEKSVAILTPIWELDETETSNNWTSIREDAEKQWNVAIAELALDYDFDRYGDAHQDGRQITVKADGSVDLEKERKRDPEGVAD